MSGNAAVDVAARYLAVRGRIEAACGEAGRDPGEVVLVGASKLQSVARMQAAWDAGLRHFGENRVQEAEAKRPRLPDAATWHLLGPLQSNKVKKAVALFSIIHSVDRLKIARLLEREAGRSGVRLEGFLEVNLGDEPSKHGFRPSELASVAGPLGELEHLRIGGLMAIPPFEPDPAAARGWFARLRRLRDELAAAPGWGGFPGRLSMGMSHDFEAAILEGATHVRVGTDLFGERP